MTESDMLGVRGSRRSVEALDFIALELTEPDGATQPSFQADVHIDAEATRTCALIARSNSLAGALDALLHTSLAKRTRIQFGYEPHTRLDAGQCLSSQGPETRAHFCAAGGVAAHAIQAARTGG